MDHSDINSLTWALMRLRIGLGPLSYYKVRFELKGFAIAISKSVEWGTRLYVSWERHAQVTPTLSARYPLKHVDVFLSIECVLKINSISHKCDMKWMKYLNWTWLNGNICKRWCDALECWKVRSKMKCDVVCSLVSLELIYYT